MNPHRPAPLPSHPLLSSSIASPHSNSVNSQSNGALSALSAVLLGNKRADLPQKNDGSGLLARRLAKGGQRKVVDEVVEMEFDFLRPFQFKPPRSLKTEVHKTRSAAGGLEDLADIPALDSGGNKWKRVRTSSREDLAGEGEPDLPPSPVMLPGGWNYGTEGGLLLPGPFLEAGSSRDSFDGLLGTRHARESSAKERRIARAHAKDRPPPPAFPQSLLATASKLVTALGPPGGIDSGPLYRKWQDQDTQGLSSNAMKEKRRLERAERGLKGLEVGQRLASRWANRLRGETTAEFNFGSERKNTPSPIEGPPRNLFRAATPLSLFDDINSSATRDQFFTPPLPSFFSDGSDQPSTTSTEAVPRTPFDFAPPKPKLGPISTDAEPSPFPLTPNLLFALDDGYFVPHKKKAPHSPRIKEVGNWPPMDVLSTLEFSPNSTSNPEITPLPSTDPGQRSDFSRLLHILAIPFSFAFHRLESHLDLIVWMLVGSSRIQENDSATQTLDRVGGLLGISLHLFGFIFFVVVHAWALLGSTYATLRSITLFSHWTFLNVSGRTDLSIVAKEYFSLCHAEWNAVSAEDGVKVRPWGVLLGFLEMAAVQAMSKERYLAEGPGRLRLLNGAEEDENLDKVPLKGLSDEIPLLRQRSVKRKERPGVARRKMNRTWTLDSGEAESLIVTGGENSILEGTIINDSFDPLSYISPTLTAVSPHLDSEVALPPLDIGDSLPGFSFHPESPSSPFLLSSSPRLPAPQATPISPLLHPLPEVQPLQALIKTIKRHVRLATASYGLHSYLVAPPTPLFTPSGSRLAQHIFSHLGGIEGRNVLHVAIQKDYLGLPTTTEEAEYEPQFYLLRDDLNCEVVCVIRGTQSLHDVRIDLEAGEVDIELPSLTPGGEKEVYRCHSGFLAAAKRLLDPELSPLFAKLKHSLEEHVGYSLVLTGHSLGAAIVRIYFYAHTSLAVVLIKPQPCSQASTVAFLVAHYEPSSLSTVSESKPLVCEEGRWVTNTTSGLPPGRSVRAICFAHPTTVESRLARRCALGEEALVLSISLGCDVVVRMGIPQVREVRRALGRLEGGRKSFFDSHRGKKRSRYEILQTWWRWKRLGGGEIMMDGQGQDAKKEELRLIQEKAWKWRQEMDAFGDFESDVLHKGTGRKSDLMMIPAGRALHLDRLPSALEASRKKTIEEMMIADGDDEDEEPGVFGIYEVGNPGVFFSRPYLEADLVQKHLPKFYLDAIESL